MNTFRRRFLSLMLALLLVIGAAPVLAIPTDALEQYELLDFCDYYTSVVHLHSDGQYRMPEDLTLDDLDPEGVKFMEIMDILLAGYDQYTAFYPKELAEVYFPTGEPLVGVGVQLETSAAGLYIERILPGGSAETAGLLAGDQIVSIGGLDTRAMWYGDCTPLLRGEEGTTLSLEIRRPGESRNRRFTLTRGPVEVPYVTAQILGDTGYLYYEQFVSDRDVALFAGFMEWFKEQGATNLIIDLRANGGGDIDVAHKLLCLFAGTEGETLFSLVTNDGATEYLYKNQMVWEPQEIIVLVGENTASASEILVASLQSRGLATVIGTQTYGKAYGQSGLAFASGDMLLVTAFTIDVPDVPDYQDMGLTPDIISGVAVDIVDLSYLAPLGSARLLLPGLADTERVTALQQRLELLGYYRTDPTGIFDAYTLHALNCFQLAEGLAETRYGSLAALRLLEDYAAWLDGYEMPYDTALEIALEELHGDDEQSEVAA